MLSFFFFPLSTPAKSMWGDEDLIAILSAGQPPLLLIAITIIAIKHPPPTHSAAQPTHLGRTTERISPHYSPNNQNCILSYLHTSNLHLPTYKCTSWPPRTLRRREPASRNGTQPSPVQSETETERMRERERAN